MVGAAAAPGAGADGRSGSGMICSCAALAALEGGRGEQQGERIAAAGHGRGLGGGGRPAEEVGGERLRRAGAHEQVRARDAGAGDAVGRERAQGVKGAGSGQLGVGEGERLKPQPAIRSKCRQR